MDQSVAAWQTAKNNLAKTDQKNGESYRFVADRLRYAEYGRVSKQRDETYAGGFRTGSNSI